MVSRAYTAAANQTQTARSTRGAIADAAVANQAVGEDESIKKMLEMLGITQDRFQPIVDDGLGNMPAVNQAGTVQGLDARLGEIFGSNAFASLQDQRMRAVQHQLNQSGMTRSDAGLQQVANVPTELGFAIEEALYGRQADMMGMGYQAASDLSGLENSVVANIANIRAGHAANAMNERIASQQRSAERRSQNTSTALTLLSMGAMFFSDPRLKTNIREIGRIGTLGLYEWDWAEGVPAWAQRMNIGFLTTEVKKHYPQHVFDYHGFDAIDYQSLTEELRAAA